MSRHLQFSYPLTLDREVLLLHLKGLLKDFVPVEISIASAASKTSEIVQNPYKNLGQIWVKKE
jgi:hypothetical protein